MEFGTPLSAALLALAGVAYLAVAVLIAIDVLGDSSVSRSVAAAWIVGLVVVPYVVAIVYAIVRGGGMAARRAERVARSSRSATESARDQGAAPNS
jgi:hypothetical protein